METMVQISGVKMYLITLHAHQIYQPAQKVNEYSKSQKSAGKYGDHVQERII